MTEFCEQDLTGARFERVSLRGATFTRVFLNDASMHAVDFTGARVRGALFNETRLSGVELVDVEISGELQNVVVNGVDIAPLVDAELNRRMPERARMRPDDTDGFRAAWAILERLWKGTVARARTFPEAALHTEPGWPRVEKFPYKECLRIVLNEEWEHRLYAERDLTALEKEN